MKYLKLFEDHKETADKISQIQSEADSKTKLAIEEYKSVIDQFMFDITDDYDTSSKIEIVDVDRSLDRITKTYVHYTIEFGADEYDIFLSKLKEVIERLIESEDITYYIGHISAIIQGGGYHGGTGEQTIGGRYGRLRHPFDIAECRTKIREYIRDTHNNYPGETKLKLQISF